jgi:hypothetical protein
LPLEPLPFAGAVYRIGHVGSHSQSRTLFRSYILRKNVLTRPRVLAGNLARLHRLTPALAAEFGL